MNFSNILNPCVHEFYDIGKGKGKRGFV